MGGHILKFRYQRQMSISSPVFQWGCFPWSGPGEPLVRGENCVKNRLVLSPLSPVRFLHRAAPPRWQPAPLDWADILNQTPYGNEKSETPVIPEWLTSIAVCPWKIGGFGAQNHPSSFKLPQFQWQVYVNFREYGPIWLYKGREHWHLQGSVTLYDSWKRPCNHILTFRGTQFFKKWKP